MSGFTTELKRAVWLRDEGHCSRCGEKVLDGDVHHRRPRMMGGGNAREWWVNHHSNLVLLCRPDHDWLEAEPEEARAAGYRLDLMGGAVDPTDVLLWTWEGMWWRLHSGRDGDGLFRDPYAGLLAPFRGAPPPRLSLMTA